MVMLFPRYIDSREAKWRLQPLEKAGFQPRQLVTGDVSWPEFGGETVLLEHKTVGKLLDDMRSGVLVKQGRRMCEETRWPILLVEGRWQQSEGVLLNTRYTWEQCFSARTRVLRADLKWHPISSVREGDELLGFDEFLVEGTGPWRRLQRSKVLKVHEQKAMLSRFYLEDGTWLDVTDNHPFLTRSVGHPQDLVWREIGSINKAGNRPILSRMFNPWRSGVADWLAGFTDGEGSLSYVRKGIPEKSYTHLCLTQQSGIVLEKVKRELTNLDFGFSEHHTNSGFSSLKGTEILYIKGGIKEAIRFIGQVRPIRFLNKWDTLIMSKNGERPPPLWTNPVHIVKTHKLNPPGLQKVFNLTTTTGTYFAEGFAVHNCWNQLQTLQDMGMRLQLTTSPNHTIQRVVELAEYYGKEYHGSTIRGVAGDPRIAVLSLIHGIDQGKGQSIFARHKTLKGVAEASLEELQEAAGIGPVLAQRIYQFFRR